ncbi:Hypothetical protein A7982_11659 [Minicystis rosea]|nr:Hypothetical protein A7982_11659 [Minicystis rosea]
MSGVRERWPAALALLAALLGLTFGSLSSLDYIQHLDRQVHDVHCSYVPGLTAAQGADNACRAAMYSPYAALFRDRFWGGVPISLFAVGAFGFFTAFALYMLLAGRAAPKKAIIFLGVFGVSPLLVSILMATITALRLGHFCKTCVGIYISSTLLAIACISGLVSDLRTPPIARRAVPPTFPGTADAESTVRDPETFEQKWGRPSGGIALIPAWALALGLFSAIPGLLYVSALPSYTSYISACGKLEKPAESEKALLHIATPGAKQPATLFADPLCPTCKAFHQRLVSEGMLDKLDLTLVLFPLDSDCNWMLDRPVHPGSCLVTKAIMCSEHRALQVLEWAYDRQDAILDGAKAGAGLVNVRAMIRDRWPGLDTCIDSKDTKLRLDRTLRYIVQNHLPVSTPQMFLGETRLCDEDTDMGLAYTMRKLAPALRDK